MQLRETLRAAKERVRHRLRGPRTQEINQERRDNHNFWTDEQLEDTDEQLEDTDEENSNN